MERRWRKEELDMTGLIRRRRGELEGRREGGEEGEEGGE